MDTIVHHQCPQSIVVCACAIALRDLVTETSADAEHLRQALSGVGTVGCLALLHRHEHGYRHIHTALRFALSGDEQGLGSRGAEPCFPAPPPAPALRFPALPPPWAALMLPSAGPRGAHTARSDRLCGTTTVGPNPAPTRRSAVASAHPKPGHQRGQARACHFHAGYARPIYLLFKGSHYCQMTIRICPFPKKNGRCICVGTLRSAGGRMQWGI